MNQSVETNIQNNHTNIAIVSPGYRKPKITTT